MAGGRGGGGCSQEHLGAKGEDAVAEGGGRRKDVETSQQTIGTSVETATEQCKGGRR